MDGLGPALRTAVCTIVSKNYLHYARTLMDSAAAVQPDWERHVLLVDEVGGDFDPAGENFHLLEVSRLPLPQLRKFLFRYTILELNTAVKPWFLERLFTERGIDRVVYLDPDIYLYRPLTEVSELLSGGHLMVLTPHLTGELRDGRIPGETDILKAGTYNLGFIALSRHRQLTDFLHWWQARLEYDCRADAAAGVFVDQKWVDLAPGLFDDVAILRHPGYNVAYWNLAHRRVEKRGGEFSVNGQPLVFFHFSGVNPLAPEEFSKYQNRYDLKGLGPAAALVEDYCRAVASRGLSLCRNWSYAYAKFANGEPIADAVRFAYRQSPDLQAAAGDDPFGWDFSLLNELWDGRRHPPITRLMRALWESRPMLRFLYPDLEGRSRAAYVRAFVNFLCRDEQIAERFVEPVRRIVWQRGYGSGSLADAAVARLQPLLRLLPTRFFQRARFAAKQSLSPTRGAAVGHCGRNWTSWLKRLLPRRMVEELRRRLLGGSPDAHLRSRLRLPAEKPSGPVTGSDGLNIVGYFRAAHGIGESARNSAAAAQAAGIPCTLHELVLENDPSATLLPAAAPPLLPLPVANRHRINLFHVNADQTPDICAVLGLEFFRGRYNIAYWAWELPQFPEAWQPAFRWFDEIWTPSRFVQAALLPCTEKPVRVVPHGVRCIPDGSLERAGFGLPPKDFLFVAMYDTQSYQMRKNPEAAIAAFRKAFPRPAAVGLVLKVNHPHLHPQQVRRLKTEAARTPGIYVLDGVFSRPEVHRLLELCDACISLHRAEGFGLVLAEAMWLGKPVVATNWSGNLDFMTVENSCLVDFQLVRVERDCGPYARGQVWAEPDVDHAAHFLRRLREDAGWCERVAARGQATIRERFSPEVVGRIMRARLDEIAETLSIRCTRFAA